MIRALNELRNDLLEEKRDPGAVEDVLLKTIEAPPKKGKRRGKTQRAPERNCFLSGALLACGTYRICAMKLPIFSAAFCCICRVTWV